MKRLREAHAHIAQHGREMAQLNLASCASRGECLDRIAGEADTYRQAAKEGWLLVNGVRVEAWEGAPGGPVWPTMRELDERCPDRPCMVQSFDHHACAVNSRAFAAAGFSASSPDPASGRIVRDDHGEPSGLLLESAYGRARGAVPEPTDEQKRECVLTALTNLAGHGFTEVHELLAPPWLGPVLGELERDGRLPLESVWVYAPLADLEAAERGAKGWESERCVLAGAKVFVDGTLNSRTALMLEEYVDPLPGMPRGQAMMSQAELESAFAHVRRVMGPHRGHLSAHAIGDGAVRMFLDALENVSPHPDELGIRARIEHCEIIDAADVPRFAQLGVTASVQPCHLLYDIEVLKRYLPHRLHRVLPLRELIDQNCFPGSRPPNRGNTSGGGALWFGSDVPIVRPDPADSIQAAVHRRRSGMPADQALAPQQAITESEAWAAFGRCASE